MPSKDLACRPGRQPPDHYCCPSSFHCLSFAIFAVLSGVLVGLQFTRSLVPDDVLLLHHHPWMDKLSASKNSSSVTTCPERHRNCTACGGSTREEPLQAAEDDEELMTVAASTPRDTSGCGTKKVAFMFLTREEMPLRPLWERFFSGHRGMYSIYIHTSPDYREEPPASSVFFNRRIPSKPVQWGTASMVDAERRLLANALLDDPCNDRFVLLSESCIPLFNLTTIHVLLTNSTQSHINSFDDPRHTGRGRYSPAMSPTITLKDWRKGSQWFEVDRGLAVTIVADTTYYPLFKRLCRAPCYVDEHYLPTLVAKVAAPWRNSGRGVTYVDWSSGGSHPVTFRGREVTEGLLKGMREGRRRRNMYEGRGGREGGSCCFLFARKFHRSSVGHLLRIVPKLMGFDPRLH